MRKKNSPLVRYKILDKCFRNTGRQYFFEDLTEAINSVLFEMDPDYQGISRRQLFDDIAFMESEEGWGIDLIRKRENRRVFYRYADPNFSINNLPLNELEINEMENAIALLSQFEDMPQFENLQEMIPKLRNGIPSNTHQKIISFDSNPFLIGLEHLSPIYQAISNEKVLLVTYHPYTFEEAIVLEFHPYHLKQYNNRWFVFGLNPEADKSDWNLALDRIIDFQEIGKSYVKNIDINWNEYFEDIIGVSKPEGAFIETVKLLFFGTTGKYVESKPLHGSQKSKWLDENTLEVSIEVIPNFELERLILSYGDSVKVNKPELLTKKIESRLDGAKKLYQ
jgi:predicted DNA-binding transcriptional regulator YafY